MKPTKSIQLVLIVVFLLSNIHVHAQTYVSGGIYSNTTWTKAASPYIISGNLVVFEDVNLTIEPGTVIKFEDKAMLELRGEMKAIGTATDSIYFMSAQANATPSSWVGIKVIGVTGQYNKGGQVKMAYCHAQDAKVFVDLDYAYHGPYTFEHCYFYNCNAVNLDIAMGGTYFSNCRFEKCHDAFEGGGDNGDAYVENCEFINNVNGSHGGHIINCLFTGNSGVACYLYQTVDGCRIFNNNIGLKSDNHHDTYLINNDIHDNDIGVEIDRFWNEKNIVFRNNKICHNNTWNIKYNHTNSADLSYNCWCSTDSTFIRSKIRDGYVDTKYGLITFTYDDTTCSSTYIPTAIPHTISTTDNNVAIYPNPAGEQIIIELGYNPSNTYYFYMNDITGRTVSQMPIRSSKFTFNRNGLTAGTYFIQIYSENQIISRQKIAFY